MKRRYKVLIGVFTGFTCVSLAVAFILIFTVMWFFILGQYESGATEDGMLIGYSEFRKKAFCFGCETAGERREFTIPDTYEGIPVTMLGGYIGRGFPCPFSIAMDEWEDDMYWARDLTPAEGDTFETIKITVHIGKNLRELSYIDDFFWGVKRTEGETEETDILFKIVYSFTVDGENETFYAQEGRLYYREGDRLAEEFLYE